MVRSLSTPTAPAVAPAAEMPASPAAAARPRASIEGEQMFSNPYRAAERRQAVAPAVSDLWAQAAANAARARALAGAGGPADAREAADTRKPAQRVASVAPPPAPAQVAEQPRAAAATAATSAVSSEPLGLFQDIKPNVRALFTGG
jgi:hypothetical protein